MNDRVARVWFEDRLVGTLREREHELYLTYDPDWLGQNPFAISVGLPLLPGEQYAHAFFSGLLPEGQARERTCRAKGIDKRDDIGLLFAIGEDCAGALSVVTGERADDSLVPVEVSEVDLQTLVESKGAGFVPDGAARFSLAGAQDKQPIIVGEDGYQLPDRYHPSTHILKFETISGVCAAEYLANRLARHVGLHCVETSFRCTSAGTPYLLISRYDRQRNLQGRVTRIHQEDMLQAVGEPTALKYEADGGPGIGEVVRLIKNHTAEPVRCISQLRDWQIFNYLIGNWDGHAKNLSLLYSRAGGAPNLAPFYDLVAIEYFNILTPGTWARKLAFRIGGQDTPEKVGLDDWRAFAKSLDIPAPPMFRRLNEIADLLSVAVGQEVDTFRAEFGSNVVSDAFARMVEKRCSWVMQQLKTVN